MYILNIICVKCELIDSCDAKHELQIFKNRSFVESAKTPVQQVVHFIEYTECCKSSHGMSVQNIFAKFGFFFSGIRKLQ